MAIAMAKVRRLAVLQQDKEGLAAQLKTKNVTIKKLQEELIESMISDDVQSVNSGGRTFYLIADVSTAMVAGHSDEERKTVLHELGLDSLVKPYSASITAQVREWLKEEKAGGAGIPSVFEGLWKVTPYAKMGMRKS